MEMAEVSKEVGSGGFLGEGPEFVENPAKSQSDALEAKRKDQDGNEESDNPSEEENEVVIESIIIPQEINHFLKAWLLDPENFVHPYPSMKQKKTLQRKTGLTGSQLNNWFTNARRRTWRPIMNRILAGVDLEPVLKKGRLKWAVPNTRMCHERKGMVTLDGSLYTPEKKTSYLQAWVLASENFIHPYPNSRDRKLLSLLSELTSTQMKDWFTNARRRVWKPLMAALFRRVALAPALAREAAALLPRPGGGGGAVPLPRRGHVRVGQRGAHAVCHYEDGSVYEGAWRQGQPHGRGTITWPNASSYTGDFVEGKKHGYGCCTFPGGEVYEGKWDNDVMQGTGTLHIGSKALKGRWSDGKQQELAKKRCERDGCSKEPRFNNEGEQVGRFCTEHKLQDMVNVQSRRCEHAGCNKWPRYNFEVLTDGEWQGKFCVQHKLHGMVDVTSKRCDHPKCSSKEPRYNFEGEQMGRFCKQHKLQGMVDLKHQRSKHARRGSNNKALQFNLKGNPKGRSCAQYAVKGVLEQERCERAGCRNAAAINFEGGWRARFCAKHKVQQEGKVDNKKCEHAGCGKVARYKFEEEKVGRFCAEHRLQDMVNVNSKMCKQAWCSKRPLFNFEDEQTGGFCARHKVQGMVRLNNKKVEKDGRGTLEGMVNVRDLVDEKDVHGGHEDQKINDSSFFL